MSDVRKLPCGCIMDPFEHSGGCQRVHLLITTSNPNLGGISMSHALCGMDLYKINRAEHVVDGPDGLVFTRSINFKQAEICLICLEEAAKR